MIGSVNDSTSKPSAWRVIAAATVCGLGASLLPCWAAAGEIAVRFTDSQRYTDIGFGDAARQRNLQTLEEHMMAWGTRLPNSQRLDIEVLDVDLAGMERPWGAEPFVRVIKGRVDGPRMHLRWTLSEAGQVLAKGDDHLNDLAYAHRLPLGNRHAPLYHDCRMLDDWLRRAVLERGGHPLALPQPVPIRSP